ncbi:crotonase/enoyl-CoA hydratase family protein [Streptomyces phaeochromogenes]|uniref:crotonase/enoyl-CoA hydratase family protein n=1 Tax=Streptomyces phaeochromogenes TaxID=1923 RepID=UPI00368B3330
MHTETATVEQLAGHLKAFDLSVDEHIAEVTLLGPGPRNAMGLDFWHELPLAFGALDSVPQVRAVVLRGSGADFSSGLDLREMMPQWSEVLGPGAQAGPRTEFTREIQRLQAAVTSVAVCRKPVVAAVAGWCVGGGVDLISAADVRLASADARFSIREVRLAIVADVGSLRRLSGVLAEGHLRELALTGRDFDAGEAERIGLVNRVHPDRDALLTAARGVAAEIAANPPLAVQGTKQILNEGREDRIATGLRHVAAWNAAFLPSEDLAEAMNAFIERRPGRYGGR